MSRIADTITSDNEPMQTSPLDEKVVEHVIDEKLVVVNSDAEKGGASTDVSAGEYEDVLHESGTIHPPWSDGILERQDW